MATTHKSGTLVQVSGIYEVVHDPAHREKHDATCIKGEHFPPCKGCSKGASFRLKAKAVHLSVK